MGGFRRFLDKVFRWVPRADTQPEAISNTGSTPSAPTIVVTEPGTLLQKKPSHHTITPTLVAGINGLRDAHGPVLIQSQMPSQSTRGLAYSSVDGIRAHFSTDDINRSATPGNLGKPQTAGSSATSLPDSTGGPFAHSQNFSINRPIIGEHIVINNAPNVLERMLQYIIPGAEFDSCDRDDPPRCHPGTRVRFLEQLQARIHDNALGTRIIWLHGPAGVGKSAIMQTLAEIESPRSTCTTLFFSRPNRRDDAKKVFTTLAYRLVVVNSQYRGYLEENLAVDPTFLSKSLEEQFERLFITPFINNRVDAKSQRWVVLLDGLDECDGEEKQCRILNLIRDSIVRHAAFVPFIWIIASRPEAHLTASFAQVEVQAQGFWKLEVPIDSDDASLSVEIYLRAELAKIQQKYADFIPPRWPSEADFLKLITSSSGLFVFSSTLIGYISEEDPMTRLQYVISSIDRSRTGFNSLGLEPENPFEALDILYRHIMSTLSPNSLRVAKAILSAFLPGVVTFTPVARINLLGVCNILGFNQNVVYAALRKLHSVLAVPSHEEAHRSSIRFLHASFSDFLKDKSRSQIYYIDFDKELENIWRCYVRIVRQSMTSYKHITLSWEPEESTDADALRTNLYLTARTKWLEILVHCCHECTSCRKKPENNLSLDTSELIHIFDEFGPILFDSREPGFIEILRDWFSEGHAPSPLRQRMLFKEFRLGQLTERDVDNMFEGLSSRGWGRYVIPGSPHLVDLDLTGIDASEWKQVKRCALSAEGEPSWKRSSRVNWRVLGDLLREKEQDLVDTEFEHPARVTIMGRMPSEYCAIVGPLDTHFPSIVGREVVYLVIPYTESAVSRELTQKMPVLRRFKLGKSIKASWNR